MSKKRIFKHLHFQTLPSTNTFAKEHIDVFCENQLTLLTASEQTKGRGRYEKIWYSPKGNLYASFCFFEKAFPYFLNPLSVAVCCYKALHSLGVSLFLKWPNDLMINHKKCGGILCERLATPKGVFFIAGIGINLFWISPPSHLGQPTTALNLEGIQLSLEQLQIALTKEILKALNQGSQFQQYHNRLIHQPGDVLCCLVGKQFLKGHFVEVTNQGALVLKTDEGLQTIHSAEMIVD